MYLSKKSRFTMNVYLCLSIVINGSKSCIAQSVDGFYITMYDFPHTVHKAFRGLWIHVAHVNSVPINVVLSKPA